MATAEPTIAAISRPPFTVTGSVREPDGTPIVGAVVSAFDEDLRSSTLLGQVNTDANGAFLVRYEVSALKRPGKTAADLLVKAATMAGVAIAQSPVMFHAAPAVKITLVRGNKPLVGPPELSAVQSRLAPLLGSIQPAELTANDISYLAGAAALNAAQVPHLVAAAQNAQTTGIDQSVFFAFARQGMATALAPLLASDPAAQRQALHSAVASNLVPAGAATQADQIIASLTSAAVTQTLAPGAYRLGGTLAVTLPQTAQQNAFLSTLQAHKDTPEAFWAALATQPGFDAATLANAQLASQLAALTQYHAPLVTALLTQHTQGTIKGLPDLARLDQNGWAAVLTGNTAGGTQIGVPPGVPGATAADQLQNYATALMRRMEVAFPTIALTARLGASRIPAAADVAAFLTANPAFDLAATDANRFLVGKSVPVGVQKTLPAMQRLFRIAPRHDLIEPLLLAGFTSARSIARVPRARFVANNAAALGGTAQAEVVYRQAQNVTGSVVTLFGRYAAGLNFGTPRTMAAGASNAPQIPNWDALFGTPDFCTCTDCRSLLSPAAYLVDLLHEFIDVYLHDVQNNSGAALVLKRRPDIGTMLLDCNNTNTTLPYIDLVNELLENAVALTVTGNTAIAHDTTDGDSASLGASPEYINLQAYSILAQAVFPWGLPFDLGLAQARAYLANLNIQRHALMHIFQPNLAAPDPTDASMTSADAVAADYLGLSPMGWKLLLGTSGAAAWVSWGVSQSDWQNIWTAAGKGPTVQLFLDQSGISFQDLIDLLQTRLATALATAPTAPWQIQWNDGATASCDSATAIIQNISEAGFGLILRFLRLRRALGTTVRELDALLGMPTATSLDAPLQLNLVTLDRLRRKLHLSFIEVATWWGNIPTLPDVFNGTSLYQRMFLNPAVINPVDAAFGLNSTGTELAVTTNLIQDPAHLPSVLAGLQITASDLQLLLTTLPAPATLGAYALNLGNLSALYRVVSFARALSLSINDFLSAATMFNISFVQSGAPAMQRAPFDRTRAADAQWFAEQITLLQNATFKISDAAYFLLDTPPPAGGPAPASSDMALQLNSLAKTLQPILIAHPPPDPNWTTLGTTAVETQLATWLNLPVPALDKLMNMTPAGFAATYLKVLMDPAFVTATGTLAASDINASLAAPVPATPTAAPPLYFQVRALVRLKKIAGIASRLFLQTPEITWLADNAATLNWLDFNALPAANSPPVVTQLYPGFAKLVTMATTRTKLTPGQPFTALMPPRLPTPMITQSAYLAGLVAASNNTWSVNDLAALTGASGFNFNYPDSYWDPATLARLVTCFTALALLGTNVANVRAWITAEITVAQANDIVSLVKSGYAVAQWPAIGKSLRDPLRVAQRDALVAWLIANSQTAFGETFSGPDDLFGQLLIDPEMSSCMQTSRLIQAIQSLQLYVNRALMGLEPGVTASAGASQAWVSMQQYQLWSANRQIFLYPENWLDPTLRDDKTDLFMSLQQELQKSAVTSDSVETAYQHYLSGLNAIAHLHVCGMYHDIDPTNGIDAVYVFARDHGTPPNYYWRQFVNANYWTQWEKVDLDIGGVDVVPVVYNRRPFVFWPIFKKISIAPPTAPVPSQGGVAAPVAPPLLWVRVQIAWSSYNEDKWAAKKISDGPPLFVPVNTPERQQYIQANANSLEGSPDYLLPKGDQPYVALQDVDPDCIRADGSVDPSYFTFKAVPPAPSDTLDTLRVECFIQSWQTYIAPTQ